MDEIFWIKGNPSPPLAVVLRPHGNDWLEDDLQRMKQGGIQTLVSLLEDEEAASLGLAEEGSVAERLGMQFLSYPIPDVHLPPNVDSFRNFVEGLASRLRAGRRVGVHCRGSIGRATVTAACALIHLGWKPRCPGCDREGSRPNRSRHTGAGGLDSALSSASKSALANCPHRRRIGC